MKTLDLDSMDRSTAYHEAGHSFVAWWHFGREGWAERIEVTLDTPAEAGGIAALGYCGTRLRSPSRALWGWHTAHYSAGSAAEGLYAEHVGAWKWSEWEERTRDTLRRELEELEAWGLEPEEAQAGGDVERWWLLGRRYELDVSFPTYWRGWEEAAFQLRTDWRTVERLALELLKRRTLDTDTVFSICEEGLE